MTDGFLTQDDFVALYYVAAEVLHAPNPYEPAGGRIDFRYEPAAWFSRIKRLLNWHFVQLLDVQGLWLVNVPDEGTVQFWFLGADDPFVVT